MFRINFYQLKLKSRYLFKENYYNFIRFFNTDQRLLNSKYSKFYGKNIYTQRVKKNVTFYQQNGLRNKSSKLEIKQHKTVPIVIGLIAGSAAIYSYIKFFKKPEPVIEEQQDEEEIPYFDENLEKNLKLLEEYGPIPYLLVGAGSASYSAFKAIRTNDPTAKVLMIGEESYLPYTRTPLSKELWFVEDSDLVKNLSFKIFDDQERSIFYQKDEFYFSIPEVLDNKNGGLAVIRGRKVIRIDPVSQVVYLDNGKQISYKKCLLAPGAKPKNLRVFQEANDDVKKNISLFKTVDDFRHLWKKAAKSDSIVIIGGGFLGSELACGILHKGKPNHLKVVQIFPESGNLSTVLPEYLSKWTTNKLGNDGIHIISNVNVNSVSKKDNKVLLHLDNGETLLTDHVVVAVGAEANTDLAKVSGLEIDEKHGGFLVNTEFEARKNLWIAGDASCFYDAKLGRRRIEHYDHALVSGRLVGENMTGDSKPYSHESMFWSDLGPNIGFEGIGIVDSTLPTVGVFIKPTDEEIKPLTDESQIHKIKESKESLQNLDQRAPDPSDNYEKGIIFYLRDNIIVGIVLWNIFHKIRIARKVINEAKPFSDLTEVAKLFVDHSSDEIE